jgi:hypothetical protein
VNPWKKECLIQTHSVVHNKCVDTEGALCVEIVGGKVGFVETGVGNYRDQVQCEQFMKRHGAKALANTATTTTKTVATITTSQHQTPPPEAAPSSESEAAPAAATTEAALS